VRLLRIRIKRQNHPRAHRLGQVADELVRVGALGRLMDLLLRRVRSPEADVVEDSGLEQRRLLHATRRGPVGDVLRRGRMPKPVYHSRPLKPAVIPSPG